MSEPEVYVCQHCGSPLSSKEWMVHGSDECIGVLQAKVAELQREVERLKGLLSPLPSGEGTPMEQTITNAFDDPNAWGRTFPVFDRKPPEELPSDRLIAETVFTPSGEGLASGYVQAEGE